MKCEKVMFEDNVWIDTYIAEKCVNFERKAVLVIPGGGYSCVCADREGEPVAQAFVSRGYNAFVLHYSVAGMNTFPQQLIEASKALKHIKDNAESYGIDKENIFVVGFSAGGHLAASLGSMWNKKEIYDEISMPYGYNKPKGVMLIYPVISGISEYTHKDCFKNLLGTQNPTEEQLKEASVELSVSGESSPAYIVHAANDTCVPVENSLLLAAEYSKNNIPFEMHICPKGEHGFALGNKITWWGNEEFVFDDFDWVDLAVKWADKI